MGAHIKVQPVVQELLRIFLAAGKIVGYFCKRCDNSRGSMFDATSVVFSRICRTLISLTSSVQYCSVAKQVLSDVATEDQRKVLEAKGKVATLAKCYNNKLLSNVRFVLFSEFQVRKGHSFLIPLDYKLRLKSCLTG